MGRERETKDAYKYDQKRGTTVGRKKHNLWSCRASLIFTYFQKQYVLLIIILINNTYF